MMEPKTDKKEKQNKKENPIVRTGNGFSLEPQNINEALKICEYLSQSSLVPKAYIGKPQDILVAINYGAEFGLKPLQSLTSVAVVNGYPALYGGAPLAVVRQHPSFEFILEDNEAFAYARDHVKGWEHLSKVNPDDTSICVVKRKEEPVLVREFSKKDVEKAALGNVHKSYPKDMRKYRARGRALEAAFGDALKAFRQAEVELENQKMIEDGFYDDLTNKNEEQKTQPTQRTTLDFDEEPKQIEGQKEGIDREKLMHDITESSKQAYGDNWYQAIKEVVRTVNAQAENMLDLSDGELTTLHADVMNPENHKHNS